MFSEGQSRTVLHKYLTNNSLQNSTLLVFCKIRCGGLRWGWKDSHRDRSGGDILRLILNPPKTGPLADFAESPALFRIARGVYVISVLQRTARLFIDARLPEANGLAFWLDRTAHGWCRQVIRTDTFYRCHHLIGGSLQHIGYQYHIKQYALYEPYCFAIHWISVCCRNP